MSKSTSDKSKLDAKQKRSKRPPRILVAEDDVEMADLVVRALDKAGYDTQTCHDGLELLRYLKFSASDNGEEFDLVISDIRMPHITGLDVLRAKSYGGEFPPIILITAFGDEWTHGKARYLGAVDVFDKPFEIGDLVNRVKTLIPVGS